MKTGKAGGDRLFDHRLCRRVRTCAISKKYCFLFGFIVYIFVLFVDCFKNLSIDSFTN